MARDSKSSANSANKNPELEALAVAVRRLNHLTLLGVFSDEQTAELTAEATALAKKFEELDSGEGFQFFRSPPADTAFHPKNVDNMFPYDAVSGIYNPMAMPMRFEWHPPRAKGYANFSELYMGPPRCVHGGFIAAYFDQIMTVANSMNDTFGPTARLTIKYRKPTPIGKDLVFESWVDSVEGSKINTHAELYYDGEVTAEAEALFIMLSRERIGKLFSEK